MPPPAIMTLRACPSGFLSSLMNLIFSSVAIKKTSSSTSTTVFPVGYIGLSFLKIIPTLTSTFGKWIRNSDSFLPARGPSAKTFTATTCTKPPANWKNWKHPGWVMIFCKYSVNKILGLITSSIEKKSFLNPSSIVKYSLGLSLATVLGTLNTCFAI